MNSLLLVLLFFTTSQINSFTGEDLRAVIIAKKVRNIEELLPLLPNEFHEHYSLMFASRSLHQSSYQNPRVIMYGEKAKLIITFNGGGGQKKGEELEIMEFSDKNKSFFFSEISFSPLKFSEKNPSTCKKCHGNFPRPIWDSYPSWPGSYGSTEFHALAPEEVQGLNSFLHNAPHHPRYQHLKNLKRLEDPKAFTHSLRDRYDGKIQVFPNAQLGELLTEFNIESIIKELKNHPDFLKYRYALLSTLTSQCGDLFGLQNSLHFQKFREDVLDHNHRQDQLKKSRLRGRLTGYTPDLEIIYFLYFVEIFFKTDTGSWTLALEKRSYDFNSLKNTTHLFLELLIKEMVEDDPKLINLYRSRDYSPFYCQYLKKQTSMKDLKINDSTKLPLQTLDAKKIIQKCINCHESGVGPFFPFSTEEKMSEWLNERQLKKIHFRLSLEAGNKHMPLDTILNTEEENQIKHYFDSLIKKHPHSLEQ